MTQAFMYMPYLMYAYATATVLLLVGCRVCAWSVPGLRGVKILSWAYVCALSAVLLLSLRTAAPDWLTIIAANEAMFFYWLLLYFAVATILGVRTRYWKPGLALQAIAGVGLWYYTYIVPDLVVRIVIVSVVCTLEAAVTAIVLFRYKEPAQDQESGPSLRSLTSVLAWLAVLLASVMVARCVLTVIYPIKDFIHLNMAQVSFTYVNMLLNATGGCGVIWLAIWLHRRELQTLAQTDSLTGLLNRRAFEEILACELRRNPEGNTFAVLLADIDHFKEVNDEWGHPAGDEVIRKVGWAIRDDLRPEGVVARIGGEEFVVLLRGVSEEQAEEIAERIRERIAIMDVLPEKTRVTLSIGIAANFTVDTPQELLSRCDVATYRSKHAGRNLVTTYSSFPGKGGMAARVVRA